MIGGPSIQTLRVAVGPPVHPFLSFPAPRHLVIHESATSIAISQTHSSLFSRMQQFPTPPRSRALSRAHPLDHFFVGSWNLFGAWFLLLGASSAHARAPSAHRI